jgi:putative membrane protein
MDMPMMWYTTDSGPAWMFGMLAMWLFWFVVLAGCAWAVVRWLRPVPPPQMTPMETLHLRYARGEIDTAAFEQMRERLRDAQAAPALRS